MNPEKPAAANSNQTPAEHQALEAQLPAAHEVGHRSVAETENSQQPREIGGRDGPEPTRFGDWEKSGRCIDF